MRVELTGVHKRFADQRVLRGVDLSIAHGSHVALIGPNGSGKSTLLRALMGMLRVDGKVALDGVNPFTHRRDVAHHLAYVPQVAPHLGASVKEIVRTVCTLRNCDIGLVDARAQSLELELAAVGDLPFSSLSGGMKQKLLIAVAFSTGSSLYILDEPTASLDVRARARFAKLLEETTEHATVLLCSHRSEEVSRFAHRVVELGDGRVMRDQGAVGASA
jgi:ABC-type multidrug transport system ATPase subunit